jgi:putative transposase
VYTVALVFYDFSNYGTYDLLTNDGLTQWHPAFLGLGKTLDECAKKYRGFCQRYKPKAKPASNSNWGSKLLAGRKISRNKGKHKSSPGQLTLWEQCQVSECPQVAEVVKKFVRDETFCS